MVDNDLIECTSKLTLLYVEDSYESLELTLELFEDFFEHIITAKDGKEAIEKFNAHKVDIIITDINMPVMNGLDMLKEIRTTNKEIPVLVLSAYSEPEYFIESIKLGVNGYILKPIDYQQMNDTLSTVLENIKLKEDLEEQKTKLASLNSDLEDQMIQKIAEIYKLNEEILATQREVIFTMGAIGESRSEETGNHVRRVALYSEILAKYYGLSVKETNLLKEASPMHDIGKVAIPDAILNKKGMLSDAERELMKTHTTQGYEMLKHSKRELLKVAAIVSYEHHERYDGLGYPNGLKGEDISIYARITSVADVFDALASDRCYKKAWSDEKINELFLRERGKQFDPKLIDIFFENIEEFYSIREQYKDF